MRVWHPDTPASEYPWRGERLSFTTLKKIDKSPAHFLDACRTKYEPVRGQLLGTLTHTGILGGPEPVIYEGTRRGKEYDAFAALHPGETIYSASEAGIAAACIDAFRTAPHNANARRELEGCEYEVPMEWTFHGLPFRTRGVDILQRGPDAIKDLKTGPAQEDVLEYHARKMFYFEQLACNDDGARQVFGMDPQRHVIISGELVRPYCFTALEMSAIDLDDARKRLRTWTDLLKRCLDRNEWPGYVTTTVMAKHAKIDLTGLDEIDPTTGELP